jgi:GH24 family phage-related lysozyme (muramidase)/murein DD-endopeptidase MepM/ murein hydrolase activator NlpD
MQNSNNPNDYRSAVTIFLKDQFGVPINNLKVEIRGLGDQASHLHHAASTDARGAVQFVARQGDDLSVHVKRWTTDTMKEVARLNAALSQIAFHLTSPKTQHDLPTKTDDSAGGDYWRGTYTVKAHDNLTAIARKYHTSIDLLKHVNHLTDDMILVGQTLKVPPVQSRKSGQPALRRPDPKGTPPKNNHDNNDHGGPTTTPPKGVPPIIFPVKVRPLNDDGGVYGTTACNYTWNKLLGSPGSQQARFGANREGGNRKHAARDLYLERYTEVVAIAPGVVIKCEPFYCQTNQISVHHTTTDGRQFITLYGEVDPHSIKVKVGDHVNQGDLLAKSGVLMKAGNVPLHVVGNQNVSMLHFEAYSGSAGFNPSSKLNGGSLPAPFHRRSDLIDSLVILQEGYRATFLDALPLEPVGNRIPIDQLRTSSRGKEFIKGWEGVKYDSGRQNTLYYEDSKGYCTVGWGHLVDEESCASLGFTALVSKMSVDEADTLFEKDVLKHEGYVKDAIVAPLFQNEFDALVSLAFNCGHIKKVAPKLCEKVNGSNYADAPTELLDMENQKRRISEYNIFHSCVYDASH